MTRVQRQLLVLSLVLAASLPGTVLEAGSRKPADKPRAGGFDTVRTVREILVAVWNRHGWAIDPNGSPEVSVHSCLSGERDLSSCKEVDTLNRRNPAIAPSNH